MSQSNPNQVHSFLAGDTLAAFRIVAVGTTKYTVDVWETSTSAPIGITADSADSGASIAVILSGTSKVRAGANITCGDVLAPLTAGSGVVTPQATHNTSTSEVAPCVGIALESFSIGADGEMLIQICNQVLR